MKKVYYHQSFRAGGVLMGRFNFPNFSDTKNIYCDPSLEPTGRDILNEGSKHINLYRNMGNIPR